MGGSCLSFFFTMAESKNHTNNNQVRKAHRNGIHKAAKKHKMSFKGMDPKFLRNARYATNGARETAEAKEARISKAKMDADKAAAVAKAKEEARKKEFEDEKQRQMLSKAKTKK